MRTTNIVVLCLCLVAPAAADAQADEPGSEPVEASAEAVSATAEIVVEAEPRSADLTQRAVPSLEVSPEPPPRGLDESQDPSAGAEEPEPVGEELPEPPQEIFLHGFRLGYLYVHGIETPLDPREPSGQRYWERYDMRTPHLFMIGYEATVRMIGYDWLNVIVTGNVLIAGLEQSRFFPSLNLALGFEIAQIAQIGIGVSLTPTKEEPAHMLIAAGFTPRIGSFYVPLHAFLVPDMNGHHKFGITMGINFF